MRVLLVLISSCLICFSCSTNRTASKLSNSKRVEERTPLFKEGLNEAVFRGSISVYKHYFSGIFALKQDGIDQYRMLLMSEVGMTLFDMSFTSDSYDLNYCMEPIRKKSLFKLMHQDFLLLVKAPKQEGLRFKDEEKAILKYQKKESRDFYFYENTLMQKIDSKGFFNRIHIEFNEQEKGVSNSIQIQHWPIKLKMELKRIK
ncbi:hypothetical protein [Labilibaculum antarcticum]|uniref:DUF4292 domain-containing protein n=1 Tax=Labilibaculum antarcticum TaxID=1717717 RepID=A0A1Y1CR98_9BACT|nr:hypothetical protein [Labilibaculum antarcticum]BAX82452.1 hypothetical protein ALGA_4161 [Labilibaculum antarcticum]